MTTPSNQSNASQIEKRPVGRPARIMSMVPNRSLNERAKAINDYHYSSEAAYGQACQYAVLCGMELLASKEQVAHGEWIPWVESNCDFSRMTAQRYMLLADRAIPVIQKNYPAFMALAEPIAPSLMNAKSRQLLISAVSEMTDQKTIQELQLELGIIKPKTEGTPGGANNPFGRAGNPATIMDRTEADRLKANKDWSDVCRIIVTGCHAKNYRHLDKIRLWEVRETMRSVLDELEDFLKKSK